MPGSAGGGRRLDDPAASLESEPDNFRDSDEDASGPSQFNLSSILGEKIRAIPNDLDAG